MHSGLTRLLLVDDHSLFREGLSRLLADEPDLQITSQCGSVEELRHALSAPEPHADLMLLDFDLRDGNAFDALRLGQAFGFKGKVLLVTAGMAADEMARALHAGAMGIFLKHRPPGDLVGAIRQVMSGEQWLEPAYAQSLARAMHAGSPAHGSVLPLSARERTVLQGVFEGRANKEIAAALELSEGTVKAVLQQLFAKTGVRTRAQLVRIALEHRYRYKAESGGNLAG